MKLLVITNLFPNQQEPGRGVFNKQQFAHLAKHCELRVVAPIPCKQLAVSSREVIAGIRTYHPRYFSIPNISRRWLWQFYYLGIRKTIMLIHKDFPFDIILATWAYPDCYAASIIARKMNKPLICKIHGSDINVYLKASWCRTLVTQAFQAAKKVIAVSRSLHDKIASLGINPNKIHVIQNGIDSRFFRKLDRNECRQKLDFQRDKLHGLFVGNLVAIKGVDVLIEAFKYLSENTHLNILGEGELKKRLLHQVNALGISHRVKFHGRVAHHELPIWNNASDVLCLPSLNEGCPNVILESLACGIPVVGSDVGGIPELINRQEKGIVVPAQNPMALADALEKVLMNPEKFTPQADMVMSWEESALNLFTVIDQGFREFSTHP